MIFCRAKVASLTLSRITSATLCASHCRLAAAALAGRGGRLVATEGRRHSRIWPICHSEPYTAAGAACNRECSPLGRGLFCPCKSHKVPVSWWRKPSSGLPCTCFQTVPSLAAAEVSGTNQLFYCMYVLSAGTHVVRPKFDRLQQTGLHICHATKTLASDDMMHVKFLTISSCAPHGSSICFYAA